MNEGRRFIAEVKKHECLWQTSDIAYGDKDVKAKAWQKVLEAIHPEWKTLSLEDKMNKGNDVQRKWKNIRDSFKKELNKQQASVKNMDGQTVEKRKRYKYFDDLVFLIPHSTVCRTPISKAHHPIKQEYRIEDDDESDSNDTPPPIKRFHHSSGTKSTSPNDYVDDNNITISTSKGTNYNKKTESFEEILMDFSTNFVHECHPESVSKSRAGTESFEDVAFFMSLVPSVQKLNDDQKLLFRMDVLNALKHVRDIGRDGYS